MNGLQTTWMVIPVLSLLMCGCSSGTTPRSSESSPPETKSEQPSPQDLDADKLAEKIAKEGTASVPGLAPDSSDPGTIFHSEHKSYEKHSVTSMVFSVHDNWQISYKAGPVNMTRDGTGFIPISALEVELFKGSDTRTEHGELIIDKQFSTIPIFANEIDSDVVIFPTGGEFFIRISSTVPYEIVVRQ